jgi:hypothetical protein
MALAILELVEADESKLWFRIDTGTNTHYQLKVGREVRRDSADEWVDDVYFSLPLQRNDATGGVFDAAKEISVPRGNFERGKSFVQLVSSKAGGRAHAASAVIAVPGASFMPSDRVAGLSTRFSGVPVMTDDTPPKNLRVLSNRSAPFARQASIEGLLGEIVKLASPVVLKLLQSAPGAEAGSAGSAGTSSAGAPAELIAQILQSLLGVLSPGAGAATSHSSSLAISMSGGNRFLDDNPPMVRPFIFGIDDALIASLVGPMLQVLPQLMNAANQKRIQLKQADNQLVGGILSDINKRMMMDKLLDAQKAAQAQGPAAVLDPEQLKTLADLLSQFPAAPPGAAVPAAVAPLSLPADAREVYAMSERAMLTFAFAPPAEWNGTAKPVFDRSRTLTLKPRLAVIGPAPKAPLEKAILKVALHDVDNPVVRLEKVFKLKKVLANSVMECSFEAGELAHLPHNTCFTVLAELRWRNARSGHETRALGSSELVLVNKYFLKARGPELSAERELADMTRYRSFWNEIWEAPVLDGARGGAGDRKKYSWELDVSTRYSAFLSAAHDSNGIMQTKILGEADDPESMTLAVKGRMKAGVELSIAELNKLIPLWGGAPVLDAARLEALSAKPFLEGAAREFKYGFKLKGRAGQAGMVWVIPVFKLFALTLSAVTAVDDAGQVNATAEEDIQFPLPVAARLIGLKSAA